MRKAHQILSFSSILIKFVRHSELNSITKFFFSLFIYSIFFIGTPPTQFPAGPSSSSPRASIPSNNSTSPSSGMGYN